MKLIIKECQEGLEAEEEWMAGKVTNDDVSSLTRERCSEEDSSLASSATDRQIIWRFFSR